MKSLARKPKKKLVIEEEEDIQNSDDIDDMSEPDAEETRQVMKEVVSEEEEEETTPETEDSEKIGSEETQPTPIQSPIHVTTPPISQTPPTPPVTQAPPTPPPMNPPQPSPETNPNPQAKEKSTTTDAVASSEKSEVIAIVVTPQKRMRTKTTARKSPRIKLVGILEEPNVEEAVMEEPNVAASSAAISKQPLVVIASNVVASGPAAKGHRRGRAKEEKDQSSIEQEAKQGQL